MLTGFLLSGKVIDLTADNVLITSQKLNIDKYGNVHIVSEDSTASFKVEDYEGNIVEVYPRKSLYGAQRWWTKKL